MGSKSFKYTLVFIAILWAFIMEIMLFAYFAGAL